MDSIAVPHWYVYILCRPDGSPFYVGKGSGNRVFIHEWEAKQGIRSKKCNIIRKIWRNGGEVEHYIVFTTDNEEAAFAKERELIAKYGKKLLSNLTDGGEGLSNPSPEVKAKMAAPHIGAKRSEETRAKMRAAWTKRTDRRSGPTAFSPEHRERLRVASIRRYDALGRKPKPEVASRWSPEHRAKLSEAQRKRAPYKRPPFSAEHKENMRVAALQMTSEHREKLRQSALQMTPEHKEKLRVAALAREARKRHEKGG